MKSFYTFTDSTGATIFKYVAESIEQANEAYQVKTGNDPSLANVSSNEMVEKVKAPKKEKVKHIPQPVNDSYVCSYCAELWGAEKPLNKRKVSFCSGCWDFYLAECKLKWRRIFNKYNGKINAHSAETSEE